MRLRSTFSAKRVNPVWLGHFNTSYDYHNFVILCAVNGCLVRCMTMMLRLSYSKWVLEYIINQPNIKQ